MKRPRPIVWWIITAVLALATAGLWFLLNAQGVTTLGSVVYIIGSVLGFVWLLAGLLWWSELGWVAKVTKLLLLTVGLGLLVGFCFSLGFTGAGIVFAGIWGMSIVFIVGLELLRLAFSPGFAVLGVARTLLDEAIRMKMALIFVIGIVLLVPFLSAAGGDETRLQYRIESFLTYTLMVITTLLSAMTVLLAVRTVSSELSDRQAYLTLTKPISRTGYLAGKWIGIMGLNLLMLTVSGVGVVAFVKVLEQQPAMDAADYIAVREQVLTARASAAPRPVGDAGLQIDYENRLRELRERGADPMIYGNLGDPITQVDPAQRAAIQADALRQWLSIPPRNQTTYRFAGLSRAKGAGPTLQLKFQPKAASAPEDAMVRLEMRINDRPYANPLPDPQLFGRPIPPIRNDTFHTATISTEDIRSDGTLDLTIINAGADLGQSTVSFAPGEGLEVFYKVGSFEGNLARGLLVMWVRLGFLAALGLAAATFLGFPVACLLCFLIFFAAVGSDYLSESLSSYASIPRDEVPWWDKIWLTVGKFIGEVKAGKYFDAFKLIIRLIGEGFTFVVPPMSRYSPTPLIAYGRAVETPMITGVLFRIGLISTGVVALFAAFVFRRREIARVTV